MKLIVEKILFVIGKIILVPIFFLIIVPLMQGLYWTLEGIDGFRYLTRHKKYYVNQYKIYQV